MYHPSREDCQGESQYGIGDMYSLSRVRSTLSRLTPIFVRIQPNQSRSNPISLNPTQSVLIQPNQYSTTRTRATWPIDLAPARHMLRSHCILVSFRPGTISDDQTGSPALWAEPTIFMDAHTILSTILSPSYLVQMRRPAPFTNPLASPHPPTRHTRSLPIRL